LSLEDIRAIVGLRKYFPADFIVVHFKYLGETVMKSFLRRKQAQAIAALVMAIVVLATLIGLGLSTGIAGAASPNGSGAHKEPLTTTNRDCDGVVSGTPQTESFGFVIINKTASGKLIANVVLENAIANTTYNFRLIQTPNSVTGDCQPFNGPGEATLTTDALGNGNANYQEVVIDGATGAFVAINNAANPANDFFTTQVVNP
jgi:hypothetical protein